MHMLATSSVFSAVGWCSGWVMWRRLGVSPGVAAYRDICMRVAIRAGMAESVPSGLGGSSLSPVEGRTPRAANGGSPLGILCWETGAEALGKVHCSCSKAPWSCRLMAVAISWGCSMVLAREGSGTSVVVEAWVVVVTLRLHAAKVHFYQLWFMGRFARGSSIPKGQHLEGKL